MGSATFVRINSWNYNQDWIYLKADGLTIWKQTFGHNPPHGTDKCEIAPVTATVPHTGKELSIEWSGNLNEEKSSESWGVKDIQVSVCGPVTTSTMTNTGTTTTTSTTTTVTTTPEFDCKAGVARWRGAWSLAKKAWCCRNAGEGCQYNCDADYATWEKSWSEEKKVWCCHAEAVGCQTTVVTTTAAPPLGTCTPQLSKHNSWCHKFCNNGAEECKDLCAERCSLGTCPCKPRRTGLFLGW